MNVATELWRWYEVCEDVVVLVLFCIFLLCHHPYLYYLLVPY